MKAGLLGLFIVARKVLDFECRTKHNVSYQMSILGLLFANSIVFVAASNSRNIEFCVHGLSGVVMVIVPATNI